MIDLEQEVEITWVNSNRHYYETKGYLYTNLFDKLLVKVKDLLPLSKVEVIIKCDYCGKDFYRKYCDYTRYNSITKKDACNECKYHKAYDTNLIKYGTRIPNSTIKTFNELRIEFYNRGYEFVSCNIERFSHKIPIYYRCNKHPEIIQHITYDSFIHNKGCKFCGIEKRSASRRISYEEVVKIFEIRNCKLLSSDYNNSSQKLEYICLNHPDIIQNKILSHFKKYPCKYCEDESTRGKGSSHWKGGTTPLHSYLREKMIDWKRDTMRACNYRCVITDNRFDDIHHIYGFDAILSEIFKITQLEIKTIGEYTEKELEQILNVCYELHYKYGYGACLEHSVHMLYHKLYNYGNNTPEQFEEFCQRYLAGEFCDVV